MTALMKESVGSGAVAMGALGAVLAMPFFSEWFAPVVGLLAGAPCGAFIGWFICSRQQQESDDAKR